MKIFLTGVTGFVGKVVLEELLRRQDEFGLERVDLLIRPSEREPNPEQRFKKEVAASPCFSRLPPDWTRRVAVVPGELTLENCGMFPPEWERLSKEVTHIINCAASVEFDLPVEEAAAANILSSLHVLEFAKACVGLKRMVSVSTAYVTPHAGNIPIEEKIVPLKRPAGEIYREILSGKVDTQELLKETGHPNTYTLTKCLAEHLLSEKRGSVPLAIVRPSIVSASWKTPFPGWIDSRAAFAGFVALIGSGYLRSVVAQYPVRLDVVPCDVVAHRIVETTVRENADDPGSLEIRHAVAGLHGSCRIRTCIEVIEGFFRRHPADRYPHLIYVGSKNWKFKLKEFWHHHLPLGLTRTWCSLTGKRKQKKRVRRLTSQLNYLNRGFPYFTHHTFDFKASMPLSDPDFVKAEYIETVCRGVHGHLLRLREREVVFAGRSHRGFFSDLRWAWGQPEGNWAVRFSAYLSRKVLRRCAEKISFDRPAFEAARRAAGERNLVVIPTHRSYLDFVLCSYLFFDQPGLGIGIPHIAAAEEFSKIPFLGWLFKKTQAFYVKRDLGQRQEALNQRIDDLVGAGKTLEFFIEGTRSRSRQFLKPKRGLLRSLQATGERFALIPVSISYDRMPEEATFLKELAGMPKPKMRLAELFAWLKRMRVGMVRLGRIHISCGAPVELGPDSSVHGVSHEVMGELQAGMATTSYHLACFLEKNPEVKVSLDWLKNAVETRGGRVVESPLAHLAKTNPSVERTMRYQWEHRFYSKALEVSPKQPAIRHHVVRHQYHASASVRTDEADPRFLRLIQALFEPVCRDYSRVVQSLGPANGPLPIPTAREIVRQMPFAHLPTLEGAFEDLVERGILVSPDKAERHSWGPQAKDIDVYRAQCEWPDDVIPLQAVG